MDTLSSSPDALRALLRWYEDMGVDDLIGEHPSDMRRWGAPPKLAQPSAARAPLSTPTSGAPKTRAPSPTPVSAAPIPADQAALEAARLAAAAPTVEALRAAINAFEGCSLKPGARTTVIDDGIDHAPLMILGEAPGRDEDRLGKPFVGRAGQLLDKMLAAIGHSRAENAFITNAIYWRPPGNRTPNDTEIAICLPFVQRMIELQKPKIIITMGNVPTQTLFKGTAGITRARGKWQTHTTGDGQEIPALPLFHPAYLLRQPQQKKLAWHDLQAVKAKLDAS